MKYCIEIVLVVIAFVQAKDFWKYRPNNINVIPRKITIPELRIVGGNEADPHSFPHAVVVYIDGRSFCGGSVISKDVILTAAHCVDTIKSVEIVVGAHNVNNDEPTQQRRTATTFVVHENWNRANLTNDIALIRLNSSLELNDFVKIVQIDEGDCLGPGLDHTEGTVVGWGRFGTGGGISPVLRFITNQILTTAECKGWYDVIKDTHICLSGSGGRGSCNGDSGSELLVTRNGTLVEVGVVSFGSAYGCDVGFPSVFARVACYKDWIKNKL